MPLVVAECRDAFLRCLARPRDSRSSRHQSPLLVLAMLFTVTTITTPTGDDSIAAADIRRRSTCRRADGVHLLGVRLSTWSRSCRRWLLDRFGSKTTYLFGLTLWSLFTMFQGRGLSGGRAAVARCSCCASRWRRRSPVVPGNGRITSAWFQQRARAGVGDLQTRPVLRHGLVRSHHGMARHAFGWQSVST